MQNCHKIFINTLYSAFVINEESFISDSLISHTSTFKIHGFKNNLLRRRRSSLSRQCREMQLLLRCAWLLLVIFSDVGAATALGWPDSRGFLQQAADKTMAENKDLLFFMTHNWETSSVFSVAFRIDFITFAFCLDFDILSHSRNINSTMWALTVHQVRQTHPDVYKKLTILLVIYSTNIQYNNKH